MNFERVLVDYKRRFTNPPLHTQGENVFRSLLRAGAERDIQLRIAQNAPTKSNPNANTVQLAKEANAEVKCWCLLNACFKITIYFYSLGKYLFSSTLSPAAFYPRTSFSRNICCCWGESFFSFSYVSLNIRNAVYSTLLSFNNVSFCFFFVCFPFQSTLKVRAAKLIFEIISNYKSFQRASIIIIIIMQIINI